MSIKAASPKVFAVTPTPATGQTVVRTVRFASPSQTKKAGAWVVKKYAAVFKKLAE